MSGQSSEIKEQLNFLLGCIFDGAYYEFDTEEEGFRFPKDLSEHDRGLCIGWIDKLTQKKNVKGITNRLYRIFKSNQSILSGLGYEKRERLKFLINIKFRVIGLDYSRLSFPRSYSKRDRCLCLIWIGKLFLKKKVVAIIDRLFQVEHIKRASFNMSNEKANFKYWAAMPEWSYDEFLSLMFGKNPDIVNNLVILSFVNFFEKERLQKSTFIIKYAELYRIAKRTFNKYKDNKDIWLEERQKPYKLLAWGLTLIPELKLNPPQELCELVEIQEKRKLVNYEIYEKSIQEKDRLKVELEEARKKIEEIDSNSKLKDITLEALNNNDALSSGLNLAVAAAKHFWVDIDKNNTSEHPKNDEVAKWLVERGVNHTDANNIARIIRPTWAASGRKKDTKP